MSNSILYTCGGPSLRHDSDGFFFYRYYFGFQEEAFVCEAISDFVVCHIESLMPQKSDTTQQRLSLCLLQSAGDKPTPEHLAFLMSLDVTATSWMAAAALQ